jgi:hypothetical protein
VFPDAALQEIAGQRRLGQLQQLRRRRLGAQPRKQLAKTLEVVRVVTFARLELGDGEVHVTRHA